MGPCAQCQHFRKVKPPSQRLATTFSTSHAEVTQALNKIVEDENKQRDEEAQYKRAQAASGKGDWAYKPLMTDFCGLSEAKGEYYIFEVRNAGMRCEQHSTEKAPRHACADCGHRMTPDGVAKDRAQEEMFGKMIVQAAGAQASASQPEALLKSHREGSASRKAFELAGIYSTKGVLSTKPSYADYCGLLSTPDEFVICAFYNPHHSCDKWATAGAQPAAAAPAVAAPAPASLGPAAVAPAPSVAPMAAMLPGLVPPPIPPAATGADVLVPGPVPLTRAMAQNFAGALAWMLDVQVPRDLATAIQASLIAEWAKGDPNTMGQTQNFLTLFDQVRAQNVETRDAVREERQAEFVNALRADGDATSVALIELYDIANAPIALGNPPLTREIANCYFDLVGLVQALQTGVEWYPLPEQAKQAHINMLTQQYHMMPPAQQAWFGNLPRGFTNLRASWKNVPPQQREQLRMQILSQLGALANQMPMMMGFQQQPLGGGAPAQPAPGGYAPPQGAGRGLPGQSASSEELVATILAADEKQEAELEKENPELALQAKLQNQARNAQMLSNMMQMRMQSMMAVAQNFRA